MPQAKDIIGHFALREISFRACLWRPLAVLVVGFSITVRGSFIPFTIGCYLNGCDGYWESRMAADLSGDGRSGVVSTIGEHE